MRWRGSLWAGRRWQLAVVAGVLLLGGVEASWAQTTLTPTVTQLTLVDTPINYGDIIANSAHEGTYTLVDGTLQKISSKADLDFYIDNVLACHMADDSSGTCPFPTGQEPDGSGFPVGTYSIYSAFVGDSTYAPSSSTPQNVVILPILASSLNPSTFGDAVTFTATVGNATYNTAGTVTFLEGSTVLGSGPVGADGTATFTTSTLAVGTHNITVCLADTEDGNTYCSNPMTPLAQMVNPVVTPPPPPPPPPPPVTGTFTLVVNPVALSVGVGNSAAVMVTVTTPSNFTQTVQLGCSGLPYEATCTFVQPVLGVSGGSTQLMVSPEAPHNCGVSTPDFVAPNVRMGMVGLGLGVLALFGMRRRRRFLKALMLVGVLAMLPMLGGCGSRCKDFGTEPANYTFSVTATSMGSPAQSLAQAVTMKVHL